MSWLDHITVYSVIRMWSHIKIFYRWSPFVITVCSHLHFYWDGIWDFRGRGEQEIHALVEFYVEKTNLERNLKNRNANMKRKNGHLLIWLQQKLSKFFSTQSQLFWLYHFIPSATSYIKCLPIKDLWISRNVKTPSDSL